MAKTKLTQVVAQRREKLNSIKELEASQVLIPVASWSKEKDATGKPNSGLLCKREDGEPGGTLDINDMLAALGEKGMKILGFYVTSNADGTFTLEAPEKIVGLTICKGEYTLATAPTKTKE